jgi:hypothetical protein
VFGVRMVRADQ